MIRCFVSDLDGTLLDGQASLTAESAAEIKAAVNCGYQFVIASGRSQGSVDKLLTPYQINCVRILCNGALILDGDNTVLYAKPLDTERIKATTTVLSERNFDIQLYTSAGNAAFDAERIKQRFVNSIMKERNMTQQQASAYIQERFFFDYETIIENLDAYLAKNPVIYKLEAYCDNEVQLYEAIQALSPIAKLDVNIAGLGLEITDIDAQKGIALDWLTQKLGLRNDEVAVFGDGMNDRMMLERYVHSYVPENATAEVKAFGNHVIGSHKDQSVAKTIKRIVTEQGSL